MLVYLDMLCAALLARDSMQIGELLRHPMARALPHHVRDEATRIMRAGPAAVAAPVHTLHFQHQMAHVLGIGHAAPSGQPDLPQASGL